ncbi:hypothetical protein RUM44_005402 [Polyplax serrata]|uniref:CUE domain-containing protein n=1 Tax=Polyplax serrata TaxID=468196 RepID=A0ABR1ADF8_POLSC
MADNENSDCSCSNIAIMQLFHELKQRYPTVPDQLVSKVIQENYHDKDACEVILSRENRTFLQSYPGALISGSTRETTNRKPLCDHCPAFKVSMAERSSFTPTSDRTQVQAFPYTQESCIYLNKANSKGSDESISKSCNLQKGKTKLTDNVDENANTGETDSPSKPKAICDKKTDEVSTRLPRKLLVDSPPLSADTANMESTELTSCASSRTCYSDCDSDMKSDLTERFLSCDLPKDTGYPDVEGIRWTVHKEGHDIDCHQVPVHNYQVAVQYSMKQSQPEHRGEQQRSYTTLNFNVRPPSSEPQAPIEIQSGQNLTYTSSIFDAKSGVQSQFQIVIGPALLEKQRERKNLLAWELRKEQDKLQHMQNEVRLMKASIAQKPSPHLLPKLKTEIEKLRAECEKLTAAVDLYSDTQNAFPLGETDEEFYRNIYTGQTLQSEWSWKLELPVMYIP